MLKAEIEAVKNIARIIAREEIDKIISELKEQLKKTAPVSAMDNIGGKIKRKEVEANAKL